MFTHYRRVHGVMVVLLLGALLLAACGGEDGSEAASKNGDVPYIAILMGGYNRQDFVDGVQDGLADLGYSEAKGTVRYEIFNANQDNLQLPALAEEIVAKHPDVFIAGGGLETEAAYGATTAQGKEDVPVVFVGASSTVQRGFVAGMRSSGNNLTGVDSGFTETTGKRLEYALRLIPDVQTLGVVYIADIPPSVESLTILNELAPDLGLTIVPFETARGADFDALAQAIVASDVDMVVMTPASPAQQAILTFYPALLEAGIPILGVSSNDLIAGAFASYSGESYLIGEQSARMVHQVLEGNAPADLPVEFPADPKFILNRTVIEALGIPTDNAGWDLADEVVAIDPLAP